MKSFVTYSRVSTQRQGQSGLGLAAQQDAIERYLAGQPENTVIDQYVEVESGAKNDRPKLQAAIKKCRLMGATLLVAKLDRLSRNAAMLMTLRDSGVDFVAADMPDANTLTIGIMASLAQYERELISSRTKAALKAAKARGQKLGGRRGNSSNIGDYQHLSAPAIAAKRLADAELRRDAIEPLAAEGLSHNAIAARLNAAGIPSTRGGRWTDASVRRVLLALKIE